MEKSQTLESKSIIKKRKLNYLNVYDAALGSNPFPLPNLMIEKLKYYCTFYNGQN